MIRWKYLFPILLVSGSLLFQDLSSRVHLQLDLTSKGLFSLSESSLNIVEKFGSELVTAKLFLDETDRERSRADMLIRLYQYHIPSLQFEFVSPTKNPLMVKEYEVEKNETVVWEWRGRRVHTIGFSEEIFTSGLRQFVDPVVYRVYVLRGHGEEDLERDFRQIMARMGEENYLLLDLNLEEAGRIPEDASLVLWIGPTVSLLPKEQELLEDYLRRGGRLVVGLDPLAQPQPILDTLGINLATDVIVDKRSQLFRGDFFFATAVRFPSHLITRGIDKVCVFPVARSIQIQSNVEGIELFPLAETSDSSWAELDIDSLRRESPQYDPLVDRQGPLLVAVAGEILATDAALTQRNGRFVLFGDSDFINDSYSRLGNNLDFWLNAVAWAVDREDRVAVRPRDPFHQPIILSRVEAIMLGIGMIGLLPGVWVILGIYHWKKRMN